MIWYRKGKTLPQINILFYELWNISSSMWWRRYSSPLMRFSLIASLTDGQLCDEWNLIKVGDVWGFTVPTVRKAHYHQWTSHINNPPWNHIQIYLFQLFISVLIAERGPIFFFFFFLFCVGPCANLFEVACCDDSHSSSRVQVKMEELRDFSIRIL